MGREGGWSCPWSQAQQSVELEVITSPLTLGASKRSWLSCSWSGGGTQSYPVILPATSALCSPGVLSPRDIPRDHLPSLVYSRQAAFLPGSACAHFLPTSPQNHIFSLQDLLFSTLSPAPP